jgi:hypothetical protein
MIARYSSTKPHMTSGTLSHVGSREPFRTLLSTALKMLAMDAMIPHPIRIQRTIFSRSGIWIWRIKVTGIREKKKSLVTIITRAD